MFSLTGKQNTNMYYSIIHIINKELFERNQKKEITYSKDGMLETKATSTLFSDNVNGLEVIRHFR